MKTPITAALFVLAAALAADAGHPDVTLRTGRRPDIMDRPSHRRRLRGRDHLHDTLRPYGYWVETRTYGRAWQPLVVVHDDDWHPYCHDGGWTWSAWGWYWQSRYEWGWVTFHYGRWVRSRRYGWVWIPGDTWGPAWVHWREGPEGCGWAPLPPPTRRREYGFRYRSEGGGFEVRIELSNDDYVFVRRTSFCAPDVGHVRLSSRECRVAYHTSTVVADPYECGPSRVVHVGPFRPPAPSRRLREIRRLVPGPHRPHRVGPARPHYPPTVRPAPRFPRPSRHPRATRPSRPPRPSRHPRTPPRSRDARPEDARVPSPVVRSPSRTGSRRSRRISRFLRAR